MPSSDEKYSNSYDIILRGQEISSGAQRIHDYDMLVIRLDELKMNKNQFDDYLESFSYGSRPHGGCGFGLERIVTLVLGLDNVRYASLYSRDPDRLLP